MNTYEQALEILRKEIDIIDEILIASLAKRASMVKKVGILKKQHKREVLDTKRWEKIIGKITKRAHESNLDSQYVIKIYELIHTHAQQIEHTI